MAHFTVFDSDSHVVEPPELWEKYLDPDTACSENARCGVTMAKRTRI